MGLDTEQFGTTRSDLLAMEPLPNLNKAYAAVLREERPQILTKGMKSKMVVEALAFRAIGIDSRFGACIVTSPGGSSAGRRDYSGSSAAR